MAKTAGLYSVNCVKCRVNAKILAFFRKNVQNYLQECGFMPIFAPKM